MEKIINSCQIAKLYYTKIMNYLIIDVRSSDEFSRGHVSGAVNVPLEKVSNYKIEDKNQPTIVYCASGARSAVAKKLLEGRGCTEVVNGMNAQHTLKLIS